MERFLKYFPVYTGLLIFMGYWNLHYYYRYFDINIYDFVNTGELVISFFPIIIDIFFIASIMFIIGGGFTLQPENKIMEQIQADEWKLLKKLKMVFGKELYKGRKWYIIPIHFILGLMDLLIHISAIIMLIACIYGGFMIIVYNGEELYKYYPEIVFVIIIISAVIFPWIQNKIIISAYKKYKKDIGRYIVIGELILLFLVLNTLSNYKDAKRVLIGKPDYFMSFNYKDSLYVTDTNFVFVGKTQSYVFIRDLSKNKNFIFPFDKLEKVSMKKIDYPFPFQK